MRISSVILCIFLLNMPHTAFADTVNPSQEGTALPSFYAPGNPIQEGTVIQPGAKFDFGNYTSSALVQKAWASLAVNDLEAVKSYVNEINALYARKAKEMQMTLFDYVSGSNDQIFKYWALNDVGTAEFILGKAYHIAGKDREAAQAFQAVINDYYFAQCWDPRGWFWKPASAAKDALDLIKAGVDLDFGDYRSNALVQKAWGALQARKLKIVRIYVDKVVELYRDRALEMQSSLKDYTWPSLGSAKKTFSYWALNDVGTALFILGEAYHYAGKDKEASKVYKRIINEYSFAQCWDPQGWFWNPSEVARQRLAEIGID